MASLQACILHSAVTGSIANPTRKRARTAIPHVTRDGSHWAWTSHGESSGCCSVGSLPLNQRDCPVGESVWTRPCLGSCSSFTTQHQTPALPLNRERIPDSCAASWQNRQVHTKPRATAVQPLSVPGPDSESQLWKSAAWSIEVWTYGMPCAVFQMDIAQSPAWAFLEVSV